MSSPEEVEDQNKHNKCMGRMEEAIIKNSMVNNLLDSISSLGCEIPKDFFSCIKCEEKNISGGFIQPSTVNSTAYNPKLLMNESVDISKKVFETTIIHELIHAYDICRAKTDAQNCQHNACMEIRASALRFVIESSHCICYSDLCKIETHCDNLRKVHVTEIDAIFFEILKSGFLPQ